MEKFSFIVIPDTQEIARMYPNHLKMMYEKIIENKDNWNIKKILHLGDVVNDGNKDENQFIMNKEYFNLFDKYNIPYLICIGNHDYDNLVSVNRDALMYNKYFGLNSYNKRYLGGYFEENKSENMYTKLTIDNTKFLFLSLEFGPRDEVVNWANKVISSHKDYIVLIITHSYLFCDGELVNETTSYSPKLYPPLKDSNTGKDLWNKSFKKHDNIFGVFSGHHVPKHISYRYDKALNSLVFQSYQNWQYFEEGGNGRIRLLTFDLKNNKVLLRVFNPLLNDFENKEGYNLEIPFKPLKEEISKYETLEFHEK